MRQRRASRDRRAISDLTATSFDSQSTGSLLPCSQQLLSTVAQLLLIGIPLLSSKPGARNILYLDFNGHTTPSSSEWGVFRARAFSLDGNRSHFNNAEKAFIENVWRRMTEDFAPFQYDVTTVGQA